MISPASLYGSIGYRPAVTGDRGEPWIVQMALFLGEPSLERAKRGDSLGLRFLFFCDFLRGLLSGARPESSHSRIVSNNYMYHPEI